MPDRLHVLIVEDEPSTQLSKIVEQTIPTVVIVKASVSDACIVSDQRFDLALLNIDVTNGQTYELAKVLDGQQVPYIFVSASKKHHLPEELQDAPFIAKPFKDSKIRGLVFAASNRKRFAT